jgi:hypothetical protein
LYPPSCASLAASGHAHRTRDAPLGLIESATSILLLALSVMLPYARLIETLAGGGAPPALPVTVAFITYFLISAIVALSQYSRARASM